MMNNRSTNAKQLKRIEDTVTLRFPIRGTKRSVSARSATAKRKGVYLLTDKPVAPSWKQPEPISIRFGRRLSELRNGRGVTQMQLAQRSGLDRSFISDMERGVKEPTISTLEVLAIAFNISISELMKGV